MPSYAIDGIVPVIDPSSYVHPSAVLIGDVIIGPGVFIGPCAVLRGDFGRIEMRKGSNLQDGCVVHSLPDFDCMIEEDGHIGHGAVIHAAHIGRNALVGMNAVVMDKAVVGEDAFVAACSFVKIGLQVPPRALVAGIPCKVVRMLSDEEIAGKSLGTGLYHHLNARSLASMEEVQPLSAVEAQRRRVVLPKEFFPGSTELL
ncbi:MAG: phenylacetic acid degradation protein PaaY [Candidatus Protistobacter heckmanni]|nr:phenylacetic acid degradation protein PaaY [Candidatus Protistobacter heckmanni]